MREVLIAGLTLALAAPAAARAQEAPPPLTTQDLAPVAPEAAPNPQPGDPAPAPPPSAEPKKKKKKVKVAETAGGAVGGALAKTAATAVAGPVAGIAAGLVGNQVGRGTVGLVKRMIGAEDQKDEAEPAPDVATQVPADAPGPADISDVTPPPAADADRSGPGAG